jgi:ribonuclease P protein component
VAFAIGRKVGGAVVRNRVRRQLRTLLREVVPVLEPGAWLVGAGAGAVGLSYEQLGRTLTEAIAKALAPPRTPPRLPPGTLR